MNTDRRPPQTRLLRLLALCLLLTACAAQPPRVPTGPDRQSLAEARALELAGQYRAAADRLLARGSLQPPPRRFDYHLAAIETLLRGARYDEARELLLQLEQQALTETQRFQAQLDRAELALAEEQAGAALASLGELPDWADSRLQLRYHELRARAYALTGSTLEAAREHIWIDGLLTDPEQRRQNRLQTWQLLNRLSSAELEQLPATPASDVLSGWLELLQLSRRYALQPDQFQAALVDWRARHPAHPALQDVLPEIEAHMGRIGNYPERIAVLLPLSGRLQAAGTAIQQGLLAAYYRFLTDAGDRVPALTFHDTGSRGSVAADAYRQAVTDGAEFVIGPLDKRGVQALLELESLPVPVLALNTLTGSEPSVPDDLYQFGLSPEDEAGQVAEFAWHQGFRRTVALQPESSWGQRVLGRFGDDWRSRGGILLETQSYARNPKDNAAAVKRLLNIDDSERRHQALVRLLGQRLEFEPRRRKDAQFVLMLANPEAGRLLRPLLRFYHGSDLPVLATSRIYSGVPSAAADQDVNGVMFCDMPWTLQADDDPDSLRRQVEALWPDGMRRYSRLYALGIDAFGVLPYLPELATGTLSRYHGVTGNLYVDDSGRLHRELVWARFVKGVPELLVATPATGDTDDALQGEENDATEGNHHDPARPPG